MMKARDLTCPAPFAPQIGGPPTDEDVQRMAARVRIDPKLAAKHLDECDFSAVYDKAGTRRREDWRGTSAAAATDLATQASQQAPAGRKLTYQRLVECRPLMEAAFVVLEALRAEHAKLLQRGGHGHRLEVCIALDNSGRSVRFPAVVPAVPANPPLLSWQPAHQLGPNFPFSLSTPPPLFITPRCHHAA